MNNKILTDKYKKYEMPKNMLFIVVDYNVLTKSLSNTELGLYVFLKAQAGRNILKGSTPCLSTTVGKITKMLSWQKGTKAINDMINTLVRANLIVVESCSGKTLNLAFPDDQISLINNGYCKVYAHSINKIIHSINGKQILSYIGFYTCFRSTIFEKTQESCVYDKSPRRLTMLCNLSEASIRNYFQWFRKNNILANFYVRCVRSDELTYNKYIYADMHDCNKLVEYIKDNRYGSVITEVLE